MGIELCAELKDGTWIVPSTPFDFEILKTVPNGKALRMEFTQQRNIKFHRKFFVLLQVILHYIDEPDRDRLNIHTKDELLNRLKIDLGLYDLWIVGEGAPLPVGTPVFVPKSIAFASMDNTAFDRLYKDTINVSIGQYIRMDCMNALDKAVTHLLAFE